jgi:hypothetical protein
LFLGARLPTKVSTTQSEIHHCDMLPLEGAKPLVSFRYCGQFRLVVKLGKDTHSLSWVGYCMNQPRDRTAWQHVVS